MIRVLLAVGIFLVGLGSFFFLGGLVSRVGQAISFGFGLVTVGLICLAIYEISNRLLKMQASLAAAERRQNQILDLLLRTQPMDVRLAVTNPLPPGATSAPAAAPFIPAEASPLAPAPAPAPATILPAEAEAEVAVPPRNFAAQSAVTDVTRPETAVSVPSSYTGDAEHGTVGEEQRAIPHDAPPETSSLSGNTAEEPAVRADRASGS